MPVMCFGSVSGSRNRGRIVWAQLALEIHWTALTSFRLLCKRDRKLFLCPTSRFGTSAQIPTSTRLLWFLRLSYKNLSRMRLKDQQGQVLGSPLASRSPGIAGTVVRPAQLLSHKDLLPPTLGPEASSASSKTEKNVCVFLITFAASSGPSLGSQQQAGH